MATLTILCGCEQHAMPRASRRTCALRPLERAAHSGAPGGVCFVRAARGVCSCCCAPLRAALHLAAILDASSDLFALRRLAMARAASAMVRAMMYATAATASRRPRMGSARAARRHRGVGPRASPCEVYAWQDRREKEGAGGEKCRTEGRGGEMQDKRKGGGEMQDRRKTHTRTHMHTHTHTHTPHARAHTHTRRDVVAVDPAHVLRREHHPLPGCVYLSFILHIYIYIYIYIYIMYHPL